MSVSANAEKGHAAWCGWILAGVFVLTPALAWLAPLGLAPLVVLAGLAMIAAKRISDRRMPIAAVLMLMVIWTSTSIIWSPYRPDELEDATALKLVVQLAFYWAFVCGVSAASPRLRIKAMQLLAWSMAALGVVLVVEAASGAAIFAAIRVAIGDPV